MNRIRAASVAALLALALAGLFVTRALTQNSCNDVTIISTSTCPGKITVEGTYTVADGYTLSNIVVYARPPGDVTGEGGQATASASGGCFTATVAVPDGTYAVQALMTVTDNGNGTPSYYYSDSTKVLPPPQP